MRYTCLNLSVLFPVFFLAVLPAASFAHGEGPWNDYMIDSKNTQIEQSLEQVKKTIADIALERRQVSDWPDAELRNLRISMIVLQEEVELMLAHLKEEDGIYLQITSALRDKPQAGRSVNGSYALEIALELIDYVSAMESQAAFANDLEADGITAYMFDLMDTYLDKMYVYGRLQETTGLMAAMEAADQSRTAMSDLKYHLYILFTDWGLESLAALMVDAPAEQAAATEGAEVHVYGGALPTQ